MDRHYAAHLAEKRRLLAKRHGEVLAALPESRPAQAECLDAVLDHLRRHRPDLIEVDGDRVQWIWIP